MNRRQCRICGAFLSHVNSCGVCFCHPQHPQYNVGYVALLNNTIGGPPMCAGGSRDVDGVGGWGNVVRQVENNVA